VAVEAPQNLISGAKFSIYNNKFFDISMLLLLLMAMHARRKPATLH
jgi:hypothetical protein